MTATSARRTAVPLARVMREHRAALLPLAVVLAINVVVLVARRAAAVAACGRQRAARDRGRARRRPPRTPSSSAPRRARSGKARASTDLETFYEEMLPADVAAARRMTHLRFQQKAREHDVQLPARRDDRGRS